MKVSDKELRQKGCRNKEYLESRFSCMTNCLFRDALVDSSRSACRVVNFKGKKGEAWQDEEVNEVVKEKRSMYMLQLNENESERNYQEQKNTKEASA